MEEIGHRLRAAREAKGITIEQAEEETKIRRKYLEALESGTPTELRGEVYLKGFLRTYGNYLDLDGPALVEEYKLAREGRPARATQLTAATAEAPAKRTHPSEQPAPHPPADEPTSRSSVAHPIARSEIVAQRAARARARQAGRMLEKPPFQRRRLGALVAGVVVLGGIGYIGWLIALQFFNPAGTPNQPPAAVTPPAATGTPAGQTTPTPTTPAPQLPEAPKVTMAKGPDGQYLFSVPAKEITVKVEPDPAKPVWTEVQTMDGKIIFSATLTSASPEFKGTGLKFHVGHMDGVSLVVNGQRFDKPLSSGPYWLIFTSAAPAQ